MAAKVGSSAYFVWRSLAWSRSLIHKGLIWKVGDGQNIMAFQEAWIPSLSRGVLTKNAMENQNVQVADLINREGQWDVERLAQFCWPYETEAVIGMKREGRNGEDRRLWRFEEKGQYTVKSGYLAEIGYYDSPIQSVSHDNKYWTSMVWSLKLPPKVRIFMWRAINGFIPVEANLLRHHVPTNGICQLCDKHVASTTHCLIFCSKVNATWKGSRFWCFLKGCKHMGFNEIGEQMHHKLSTMEFEVWVILLWKLWRHICNLKHEKGWDHEPISEEQGMIIWQAFQEARECMKTSMFLGIQPGERKWHEPARGTYRVDVDTMFNVARNKYGVGVIVRDCERKIVAAMARPISHPGSATRGEVLAIMYGIIFYMEQLISPITIFADSIIVVRVMAGLEEEHDMIPSDLLAIVGTADRGSMLGIFHAYRAPLGKLIMLHNMLGNSLPRSFGNFSFQTGYLM